jgi:hypothetical protein
MVEPYIYAEGIKVAMTNSRRGNLAYNHTRNDVDYPIALTNS